MRHLIIALALCATFCIGLLLGTSAPVPPALAQANNPAAQEAQSPAEIALDPIPGKQSLLVTLAIPDELGNSTTVTVPVEVQYELAVTMSSADVMKFEEGSADWLLNSGESFFYTINTPEGVTVTVKNWDDESSGEIDVIRFIAEVEQTNKAKIESAQITFQFYNQFATMWENHSQSLDKLSPGKSQTIQGAVAYYEPVDGKTQFVNINVDVDWAKD